MDLKTSAREHLRSATRAAHLRLDAVVEGMDVGQFEGYSQFLLASADALICMEKGLARGPIGAAMADWPDRARTGALLEDIGGLGLKPPAGAPAQFVPGSAAQTLGMIYVLEGSRLGSAVLAARASSSDSMIVRTNLRYLMHGRGQGLWRSFLERLEAGLATPELREEAAAAASGVFAAFESAFRRRVAVRA